MINNALFYILLMGAAEPASVPADPAATFGARESVEQASLSPNGTMLAYIAPAPGQGAALFVAPLDGKTPHKGVLLASGNPERIGGCKWAAETRILCRIYGVTKLGGVELAYFSRQVAVDADGANLKVVVKNGSGTQLGYALNGGGVVDWLPEENGNVLMTRQFIPEYSTGTLVASKAEGLGLVKVNTRTLASTTVESPRREASEYITDGRGAVRIMGMQLLAHSEGYASGRTRYL